MTWNTDRRSRLPADWPRIRARILRRDPVCTCERRNCRDHWDKPCPLPSTDVDHIIRGDLNEPSNLRGLCRRCHAVKTGHEGKAATNVHLRNRTPEPHPGLRRDVDRGGP